MLDGAESLAYHGFKKLLLFNGHGSNASLLDLVARRATWETDAECMAISWWNPITVDKEFLPCWRQGEVPGGCSHACELETSLYLHLDGGNVRHEEIAPGNLSLDDDQSPFVWVDLGTAIFRVNAHSYCAGAGRVTARSYDCFRS